MVKTTNSGLFLKGKKERCYAYTASVACNQNNFILGVKVAPGNVHDSQVFTDLFCEVDKMFPDINFVVADAGYKTSGICRDIILSGKKPVMPYKRPMTKKAFSENMTMFTMNTMIATFARKTKFYTTIHPIETAIKNIKITLRFVRDVLHYNNAPKARILLR